ncbi:hypothetical protein RD110_18785 [Rhodoferax koreense]|uniref:Uncharacterized protein n=1 Tax=Rhodoferax koreensis TaxID=1842727 RepID=A0A1P8JZ75_9BURK|nr:hypothetical protein [Rhodoferax koreense]APW39001.1 hypothetical protein RD110_18785 [Rhodoferax koreense]
MKKPAIQPFRGFLGNGAYLIAVHTKKCARERRNVPASLRIKELIVNRQDLFVAASLARRTS